ncbi:HAD domain-containing protein [Culicoidibacter larvae]|uniref:FCP1 homology domain-containing protein n=1 Tax=Culicoidibacter larvae TaxID=2579976 RepID=A0A5R8QAV7_9FIRM|nr:HAD domain-containing protein [Culicoidibacter larvae]TLG72731.1 hypothetical protein FEZ08_08495 [Culicoidibacter larvae]
MRILFLDVDGVLNSHDYLGRSEALAEGDPYKYIERDKLAILQELVYGYDFKVVLHSTWKNLFDERLVPVNKLGKALLQALADFDIVLFDKTLTVDYERQLEIVAWLKAHATLPIENYIIIDDAKIDWQELRPHVIQTNEWYGLTREDARQVSDIIG